jgi:hypothetical protein
MKTVEHWELSTEDWKNENSESESGETRRTEEVTLGHLVDDRFWWDRVSDWCSGLWFKYTVF